MYIFYILIYKIKELEIGHYSFASLPSLFSLKFAEGSYLPCIFCQIIAFLEIISMWDLFLCYYFSLLQPLLLLRISLSFIKLIIFFIKLMRIRSYIFNFYLMIWNWGFLSWSAILFPNWNYHINNLINKLHWVSCLQSIPYAF